MITLDKLVKTTKRGKKRLGRGYGSGKGGHTVGRGAKGDKARGKSKLTFGGTKIKKSWIKRLPFLRGKGGLKSETESKGLSLETLEKKFIDGEKVDIASLIKKKVLTKREAKSGVKVLGNGELKHRLTVSLSCSSEAVKKIVEAGGKVENAKTN